MQIALRGVKCNICGVIGVHHSDACPRRNEVGIPEAMRDLPPPAALQAAPGGVLTLDMESALFKAHYVDLPTDFLPCTELMDLIRKRPDVPSFLRCYGCMLLVRAPKWCSCCDIVVCTACLGPLDRHWACPKCHRIFGETADSDAQVHTVGAVSSMARLWALSCVEACDPYTAKPPPCPPAACPVNPHANPHPQPHANPHPHPHQSRGSHHTAQQQSAAPAPAPVPAPASAKAAAPRRQGHQGPRSPQTPVARHSTPIQSQSQSKKRPRNR